MILLEAINYLTKFQFVDELRKASAVGGVHYLHNYGKWPKSQMVFTNSKSACGFLFWGWITVFRPEPRTRGAIAYENVERSLNFLSSGHSGTSSTVAFESDHPR